MEFSRCLIDELDDLGTKRLSKSPKVKTHKLSRDKIRTQAEELGNSYRAHKFEKEHLKGAKQVLKGKLHIFMKCIPHIFQGMRTQSIKKNAKPIIKVYLL